MKSTFKMLGLLTLSIGVTACSDLTNSDESGIKSDVFAFKVTVNNNPYCSTRKRLRIRIIRMGQPLKIGINQQCRSYQPINGRGKELPL
jgi:hypothetical protein